MPVETKLFAGILAGGELGVSDGAVISHMARAMGEADGKRFWKTPEDDALRTAYEALARRQLYAHRAMTQLLSR